MTTIDSSPKSSPDSSPNLSGTHSSVAHSSEPNSLGFNSPGPNSPGSNSPEPKQQRGWVILVVLLFSIVTFGLTRPITTVQSGTSVAGLMTLKASAQTAVPYAVAIANRKPTLIEFYADWCTTCQSLAPTLETVTQPYGSAVNFVMLDIDDPQWQDQIQHYQVTGVPHLVLQNGEGQIADTFVGNVPAGVLTQGLQELLS